MEILENATGCNTFEEVEEACATVGVTEMHSYGSFELFPNPATTEINVIATSGEEIDALRIRTLSGQLIYSTVNVSNPVDISGLPGGVYIVEMTIDHKRWQVKLVVL